MLGNRKLILDTFCEVYDLLKPWADGEFWDLSRHNLVPGAIYIFGRTQYNTHQDSIRQWVIEDLIKVILSNPAEGSETLKWHCEFMHNCGDLMKNQQTLLIGGGDMDAEWPFLRYDNFLPKILDYDENLAAIDQGREIFDKIQKPHKFLFLNGRLRSHRKYLVEYLDVHGLLDQGIWSWLDQTRNQMSRLSFTLDGQDLMLKFRPKHYLPTQYEVPRYQHKIDTSPAEFAKYDLFDQEWGDIYLHAAPYIDTYFSIVTETVYNYPYSFRTEKIWKPIAMGHPWICVANTGYYRDLKNLGFRTFEGIIDESFDSIQHDNRRIERTAQVIRDLCGSDLISFLRAAEPVCKYNQQHLALMRHKVRAKFPKRFFQFLREHQWMT